MLSVVFVCRDYVRSAMALHMSSSDVGLYEYYQSSTTNETKHTFVVVLISQLLQPIDQLIDFIVL